MQYAMVPPMTATQHQPSEAFTIVLSTRQQPSDPLEMLLRATLQLLGCGNLPPPAKPPPPPRAAGSGKGFKDLLRQPDRRGEDAAPLPARTTSRPALLDRCRERLLALRDPTRTRTPNALNFCCGAKRILPPWYRTRPQQFVTRSRRETAGIDAVVAKRPPCPVGRTGALEAREACRAQFVLRTGRPRDCTPAPCRRS